MDLLAQAAGLGALLNTESLLMAVYGAFLFYLLANPEKVKNTTWFKLAGLVFAGSLVLHAFWMIFQAIPATEGVFTILARGVTKALVGVSIFCLIWSQVGGMANIAAEAKAATKKTTAKKE
jgi:hypothetical protein